LILFVITKMTTPNLTIVSYLGGSGGDWFTASANGQNINLVNGAHPNINTLKPHEEDIKLGLIKLENVLTYYQKPYVSTHLFEELLHLHQPIINIVISDPYVQHIVVLRQMYLQQLRIMVNPNETFFRLVQNLCQKQKFEQAAHLWFVKAKQLWLERMNTRLSHKTQQLNFNYLFDTKFVDSIRSQGWTQNISLLQQNHQLWLDKNQHFSLESTLSSMTNKLKIMNWQQSHGTIVSSLSDLT